MQNQLEFDFDENHDEDEPKGLETMISQTKVDETLTDAQQEYLQVLTEYEEKAGYFSNLGGKNSSSKAIDRLHLKHEKEFNEGYIEEIVKPVIAELQKDPKHEKIWDPDDAYYKYDQSIIQGAYTKAREKMIDRQYDTVKDVSDELLFSMSQLTKKAIERENRGESNDKALPGYRLI